MKHNIILPDMGGETKDAVVSLWHVAEGAAVREGDDIVEVATDKATFNVPAPKTGLIKKIHAAKGKTVSIGEVLAEPGKGTRKHKAAEIEPSATCVVLRRNRRKNGADKPKSEEAKG